MILLQYYTTLFQYTILTHTRIYIYIDIIILHYYITLLQVYYITPLRHILYALSILPHNEYSLRTIFIHYSIISLYTSNRTTIHSPYHNICFNALFHFLHLSSLSIYLSIYLYIEYTIFTSLHSLSIRLYIALNYI